MKRKTITLKTKQRKNTTLIDKSAVEIWCQRSHSGHLKTRENPFASWVMPSVVWPLTPTTKCKSSICSHTHNPKTKVFQPQKEKKKDFCSNKRRREEDCDCIGQMHDKTTPCNLELWILQHSIRTLVTTDRVSSALTHVQLGGIGRHMRINASGPVTKLCMPSFSMTCVEYIPGLSRPAHQVASKNKSRSTMSLRYSSQPYKCLYIVIFQLWLSKDFWNSFHKIIRCFIM